MSDWANDIRMMHLKFGVHDWFEKNKDNKELMKKLLEFRMSMIAEEYTETKIAIADGNAEEVVDGLIDLCVFAIGTLDIMGVDANKAWDAIYDANMAKQPGVKPGRPNPFGLPDLIKPNKETHGYDWQPPSHANNHGELPNILK